MIVSVTGATGYIGCHLVRLHLARGDRVRVLTRRPQAAQAPGPVEVVHCDLAHPEADALLRFCDGADVVYHCAAEIHDTKKMVAVNIEGTRTLIKTARYRIGHWVQLGSIAVYGAPQSGVISEETPFQPNSVYGHSKAEADKHVIEAAAKGGFSYSILRPSKIFGAGTASQNNEILYRMISIIDKGMFFFVGKPGALTHYVQIANVVEALMRCARERTAKNRVYNLSDDCTIDQFVAVIASALGKPFPRLRLPEPPVRLLARVFERVPGFPLTELRVAALVNRAVFPCERIQHELGYKHLVPTEQGLRELVMDWKLAR